jgi:hypothetical protein
MAHDSRWTFRWCEHSMCGWLDDGNLVSDDTRARSSGDWGKMTPTGGPRLSVTVAR